MAPTRESGANSPVEEQAPTSHTTARDDIHEQDLEASEVTPLISRPADGDPTSHSPGARRSSAVSLLKSLQGEHKSRRRWPSLIALLLLCVVAVLIMILGFLTPEIIEEYALEAAKFEPTSLSIEEITSTGVRARIQGEFSMHSSQVQKSSVRNLGRFGTWFASKVESGASSVHVSLPEYDNIDIGSAKIPPIVVDVKNGHTTHIDFVSDITPGDPESVRRIAKEWVDGKLDELHVKGKAHVPIKSGIFSLGDQVISKTLVFHNADIPTIPKYTIKKMVFTDVDLPDSGKGVAADVVISFKNEHPVDIQLPSLGFEVLVENCLSSQPRIPVAYVSSSPVHVKPKDDVTVKMLGIIRDLPADFTRNCPNKDESPMDGLIRDYMNGMDATVFVRGSTPPTADVPQWITDVISEITVPISVPGHSFGQLIESFSLTNVHFGLPDPLADDDDPESNPTISAVIEAVITLPEQMNFDINVHKVRADADVFYKGSKLGKLNLDKWQTANSSKLESNDGDQQPRLLVKSEIEKAPLQITDDKVFTEVVQALLFGRKKVTLAIKADVDVQVDTSLGLLTVRRIPAEGKVPVKR